MRRRTPRAGPGVVSAIEHHAVLDPARWLAPVGRARDLTESPVDRGPAGSGRTLAAAVDDRTARGLGDVGQQRGRHRPAGGRGRRGRPAEPGRWSHSDAVQAVGHLPVDFGRQRPRPDDLHRAQARRAVRGRRAARPARGRADRRCSTAAGRSATSAPARSTWRRSAGFAAALRSPSRDRRASGRRAARRCARGPVAAVLAAVAGRGAARPARTRRTSLPGVLNVGFPGCSADALLMLLDAAGIDCSTGSACSAGVPRAEPRADWPWAGRDRRPRSAVRFSLGHTSTAGRRRALARGPAGGGRTAPGRRRVRLTARQAGWRADGRWQTGDVDPAVTAIEDEDCDEGAGRHVRRSRLRRGRGARRRRRARRHRRPSGAVQEPAVVPLRRPRLLLQGGRPRRPAGRRRARASRSTSGTSPTGSPPTWSTTSWPSTPPAGPRTRACAATRRSSSPRCSTARVALGFDAVVHRPLRPAGRGPSSGSSCTGRSTPARTSRTCSACSTQDQLRALAASRSAARCKTEVRAEADAPRARGGRQAGQPRHLLHRRRRHRRLPGPPARPPARRRSSTRRAPRSGEHDGTHHFTVGQRRGLRLGVPGRRRPAALRAGHLAGDQHGHGRPREALAGPPRSPASGPTWTDRPRPAPWRGLVQVRAHGEPVPADDRGRRPIGIVAASWTSRSPGSRPARPSCCYDGTRVVGSATIAATAA